MKLSFFLCNKNFQTLEDCKDPIFASLGHNSLYMVSQGMQDKAGHDTLRHEGHLVQFYVYLIEIEI